MTRLRNRLEKLEFREQDTRPAILFLTDEGLKDLYGKLVKLENIEGTKIIAGLEPEDI